MPVNDFWRASVYIRPSVVMPADDRKRIPRKPFVKDWRQPLRSICPNDRGEQVKACFVHENQRSTFTRSLSPKFWPNFSSPALNLLLIPLKSSRHRNLWSPFQLLQNPRYVPGMILNTEFILQDRCNTFAIPAFSAKAISFCPMPEKIWNQSFLSRGQTRRTTGSRMCQKRLRPLKLAPFHPASHRSRGHVQNLSDSGMLPPAQI